MKSILLIGVGRFGYHIAEKLNELRHDVLAIDLREERIDQVLPIVTDGQIGDATSEEFLSSLGVRNFDLCIVTIAESFQASLETTALLKDLGAHCVVSRAANDVQEKFLLRNGADFVVYPEKQLAHWTAKRFTANHVLDYIELDEDNAIYEVELPERWKGKSVGDLNVRRNYGVSILGLKHGGGRLDLNVHADIVLKDGDSLMVLGKMEAIQKCFKI